ncbi:ATP-dependent protease subunit HslV [Candidatus Bandiella euplotis]|uniref:ATP-dependent protease subunit HslV n=1 Tax=Candidatus Bandiella euplotis TaxID=1664265 RepID=A0ABZ0UNX1_9RICK|nr:ATP-dependent protease subunit HslV [Candidatus Bandiella woodruffii]WPX96798.1 ATP-dependent protease subunit HslV [Candidatus Bandiella woodruffii]
MYYKNKEQDWHATTILCIRNEKEVVIIGDGQVSLGSTVIKNTANKIRTLAKDSIIAGFAGATADAFTLFNRLEEKLEKHSYNLMRASVELAKDWRLDKYLRRLEAMLIVADKDITLILTGNGDVLEPEDGLAAIGSGGNYALSAAKALVDVKDMKLEDIAKKAMKIAADICIYTNHNTVMKKITR